MKFIAIKTQESNIREEKKNKKISKAKFFIMLASLLFFLSNISPKQASLFS